MNNGEFESRLQRTPLRTPPPAWREQILAAASPIADDVNCRTVSVRKLTFAATLRQKLRELFWPHPVVWGALASIWLVIGAVQLALHEPTPKAAPLQIANAPGAPTVMELQRELLTAWNEPIEEPKPKPEAALPPQSCIERRRESLNV